MPPPHSRVVDELGLRQACLNPMNLLPVDDPSLTDEVSWVPASPLPEQPVQVGGGKEEMSIFNAFPHRPNTEKKNRRPLSSQRYMINSILFLLYQLVRFEKVCVSVPRQCRTQKIRPPPVGLGLRLPNFALYMYPYFSLLSSPHRNLPILVRIPRQFCGRRR